MSVVEFLGIARTGKTTVGRYLEKKYPQVCFYPERHDLVPKDVWGDNYKHNEWYAQYCVDTLHQALNKDGVNIIERGVIDRIVIGNTYFKMGWFTKSQFDKYMDILLPHIKKVDDVYVFLIPVNESVKRAKVLGKDVQKAIPYMDKLFKEYKNLPKWFSRVTYLPDDQSEDKLCNWVSEKIFKYN